MQAPGTETRIFLLAFDITPYTNYVEYDEGDTLEPYESNDLMEIPSDFGLFWALPTMDGTKSEIG